MMRKFRFVSAIAVLIFITRFFAIVFPFLYIVTEDVLYSHASGSEYLTVFFDSNGGQGSFASIMAAFGESYPEITYTPELSGYIFGGWYTQKHGGVKITAEKLVTHPENHTLYAHWLSPEQAAEEEKLSTPAAAPDDFADVEEKSVIIPVICAVVSTVSVISSVVYIVFRRRDLNIKTQ
ncbi:MAG: InlB B-repeat-containing protein [Eubacteriales bacterium]